MSAITNLLDLCDDIIAEARRELLVAGVSDSPLQQVAARLEPLCDEARDEWEIEEEVSTIQKARANELLARLQRVKKAMWEIGTQADIIIDTLEEASSCF